jgi:hypothetical protein
MLVQRDRISQFLQHADETNDIFRVAAQVIASTMLKANTLMRQKQGGPGEQAKEPAAAETPTAAGGNGSAATAKQSQTAGAAAVDQALRLVLLPWAAAHKAIWWEAVAVPEGEEEVEFRAQLRELASDSLELLQSAFPKTPFSQLFDLEVRPWGCVKGRWPAGGGYGKLPDGVLVRSAITQ